MGLLNSKRFQIVNSSTLVLPLIILALTSCTHQAVREETPIVAVESEESQRCEVIDQFNSNFILGNRVQKIFTYQITTLKSENSYKCWENIKPEADKWCHSFDDNSKLSVNVDISLVNTANNDQSVFHTQGRCVGDRFIFNEDSQIALINEDQNNNR